MSITAEHFKKKIVFVHNSTVKTHYFPFHFIYVAVLVGGLHAQLAPKLPNASEVWKEVASTYGMDCMEGSTFFKNWRTFYTKTVPE